MKKNIIFLLLGVGIISCSPTRRSAAPDDHKITVTFVQVNDVYEIAPLEGGKTGGYARVAYLKKKYQARNPNTFLVMSGDFLSPSVYNSLQYEGKRIRGRQMVETMNTAGTDMVVFGNHEFDISESELQSRLNESDFQWISSNSFHKKEGVLRPFVKTNPAGSRPIPETYIMTVNDTDGTTARIGFIGINIPFNKAAYVGYTDPLATAEKLYNQLKDSCDVVIAITHQQIKDDVLLAQKLPGLALIMGGHEHDRRYHKEGNVIITKAHANARSAYILTLKLDKKNNEVKVRDKLEWINESVPKDPATDSIVRKWTAIADKNYAALGFDAAKILINNGEPLDGRESEIRSGATNLTRLIVSAMEYAAPNADVAIMNGGSIRVDDILQMPISQYDILRTLPFGGGIVEVDLKGAILTRMLQTGRKNTGSGGFLHYSEKLSYDDAGNWKLNNLPIVPEKIYRVAMTDFLLTGGEANLDFIKKDNPAIIKVYPIITDIADPRADLRLAIIRLLEKKDGRAND